MSHPPSTWAQVMGWEGNPTFWRMILKDLRYSRLAPRKQVLSFTAPGLERTVYDAYAKEPEVQRPKSAYFSKTFETVPFTAYKYKHPAEQSNSKKSQTKNWFPVRVRRMATEYQLVTAWEDGRKQQVVLHQESGKCVICVTQRKMSVNV